MIQIKNLNKVFNENKQNQFHSLKNINLDIKKNELIILNGVSGSGKSTLLSLIASFMKPTNGSIKVKGEYIAKLPDQHISNFRLHNIGFVFQSFNLFEQLTVNQNIMTSLVPLALTNIQCDAKIDEVLKLVNIDHKKDQKVKHLSGGEKQRVAIARALVNNPDILLCDEPTAALDYENSLVLLDIIAKLKRSGKTIIIATHDPIFETIPVPCRVITLENGVIKL